MNSPQELLKKYISKKINKIDLINYLISFINASDNDKLRLDSIKIFDKIIVKNQRIFNLLENLFVSDNDSKIRNIAGHILILKYYIKKKKDKDLGFNKQLLKLYKNLDLNNENIKSLPKFFGNLTSLKYLNLDGNHLTTLPESIGNLKSLQCLYLKNNNLRSLPESICNLKFLKKLDLRGNNLQSVPKCFMIMVLLKDFDLYYELDDVPGIGYCDANNIKAAGFKSIKALANGTIDELIKIKGIGKVSAKKLIKKAKNFQCNTFNIYDKLYKYKKDYFSNLHLKKTKEILERYGIHAKFIGHPSIDGSTYIDVAKGFGIPPDHILKCLFLISKTSPKSSMAVILLASDQLDLKRLEMISGMNQLSLASNERLKELTSYDAGGVPPFAMIGIMPVYVDGNVLKKKSVIGSGGTPHYGLKFDPKIFLRLNYIVSDISL